MVISSSCVNAAITTVADKAYNTGSVSPAGEALLAEVTPIVPALRMAGEAIFLIACFSGLVVLTYRTEDRKSTFAGPKDKGFLTSLYIL